MHDGSIRIQTKVDSSGAKHDLKDLEKMAGSCARHVNDAFNNISTEKQVNNAIQQQVKIWEKAKAKAEEYEQKLSEVNGRMRDMESQAYNKFSLGGTVDPNKAQAKTDDYLTKNKDYQRLLNQSIELESKWQQQNVTMSQANSNVSALELKLQQILANASQLTSPLGVAKSALHGIGNIATKVKNGFGKLITSVHKFGSSIKKTTDSGIKRFGRMALSMLGIRSAYMMIRRATSAYLESNQELSNQINGMWNVLGQAIGPVIEKMMGYITSFISYVNALVKALTGIDLVAKANASALKKQANATKEASKQMAGFDEMQKLNSSNSSSGNSGSTSSTFDTVEVNTSWIDKLKTKMQSSFYDAGKFVGESVTDWFTNINWNKIAKEISKKVIQLGDSIAGFFSGVDWSKITRTIIKFLLALDWAGMARSLSRALGSFAGALVSVLGTAIYDAFDAIGKYFDSKIEECGGDIVDGICKGIIDALVGIGTWIYENIFEPFIEGFKDAFGIQSPSKVMAEMGRYLIEGLWKGILEKKNWFIEKWESVKSWITEIKGKVSAKFTDTKEKITTTWNNITSGVKDKTAKLKATIGTKYADLKYKWESLMSNFKDKTITIKAKIGEVIGSFKTMINTKIIDPINAKLPSIFPKIPRLARGGIVNNPTAFVAGEAGKEVVLPLQNNTQWMQDLADFINSQKGEDEGETVINLNVDGERLFTWFIKKLKQKQFAMNGG